MEDRHEEWECVNGQARSAGVGHIRQACDLSVKQAPTVPCTGELGPWQASIAKVVSILPFPSSSPSPSLSLSGFITREANKGEKNISPW